MPNQQDTEIYHIGVGIHDITGPCADCGMMGYSMADQRTKGIHTRLRSRAFIIEKNNKRVVLVVAEIGMIFQGVSLEVLDLLKKEFGDLYTVENVVLTGTHTHSAPGGFSHYTLYNLANFAYDEQNFNTICDGIFQSIKKAHHNLQPGRIKIHAKRIRKPTHPEHDYCFNRSIKGYKKNPRRERKSQDETNRVMTLLRFETPDGKEIAMLNWLAVHATNVGNKNLLISSDNKGYAAYLFEKEKGTDYLSDKTFISAFANCDCADVSPNVRGYPEPETYFKYMEENGRKQYEFAKDLYDEADTPLKGDIDYRHRYVDMSDVEIEHVRGTRRHTCILRRLFGPKKAKTCIAAIGVSKLAGAKADGKGLNCIPEGVVYGKNWLPITLTPKLQRCHKQKPIAVPSGEMKPYPWTPQILPVQLIKIGQLGLIATPFECSTMSGRRLRKVVQNQLPELTHLVVAAYANAYSCYVTTREEYSVQRYEGASTHFGPFTLQAYQQEYTKLAKAMKEGKPAESAVFPENLKDKQLIKYQGFCEFIEDPCELGKVMTDVEPLYKRKETVSVVFVGAHPRNNLRIQDTYLTVEKNENGCWQTVANDWDPEAILRWDRKLFGESEITVEWTIPDHVASGRYRIRHFGSYKMGGKMNDYTGCSSEFEVK
ncbi:MAG: neutral/alkaline ceramidase [Candidatus Omnitrophota bacterium]